jgi:hypothetical protein
LLDEKQALRGIAFSQVIFDTTGKRVLPVDLKSDLHAKVIKHISVALTEAVRQLNMPENRVYSVARINEVSSHVDDMLRDLINRSPGLSCDLPHTAQDKVQRSGYPDLRIVEVATRKASFISILSSTLPAAGTAAFARFTSSQKLRRAKCMPMPCI